MRRRAACAWRASRPCRRTPSPASTIAAKDCPRRRSTRPTASSWTRAGSPGATSRATSRRASARKRTWNSSASWSRCSASTNSIAGSDCRWSVYRRLKPARSAATARRCSARTPVSCRWCPSTAASGTRRISGPTDSRPTSCAHCPSCRTPCGTGAPSPRSSTSRSIGCATSGRTRRARSTACRSRLIAGRVSAVNECFY